LILKGFEVEPVKDSLEPTLRFTLSFEFNSPLEIPLDMEIKIISADNKLLATTICGCFLEKTLGFPLGFKEKGGSQTQLVNYYCYVPLSEKVLRHIDRIRPLHPRGDVFLKLLIRVRMLVSNVKLATIREVGELGCLPEILPAEVRNKISTMSPYFQQKLGETTIVGQTYDPDYVPPRETMWIPSTMHGSLFSLMEQEYTYIKEIPVGHWIHDFIPYLGFTKRILIEIPEKVLEHVSDLLAKAEEAFRRWDTKGVYANCREVGHRLNRIVNESKLSESVKKEKWGRVYQRFEHMASLDLHLEELRAKYPDIEIKREDAEQVLDEVKLLIRYAGELLGSVQ
jgi:hypothetical protein